MPETERAKPHIYKRRGWWEARSGINGRSLHAVSSFRTLVDLLRGRDGHAR